MNYLKLLAFLSGSCSLVYQVCWERVLKFNFGGDAISASIISSTFLLGLGVGGYLFRRAKSNPFYTYAVIELLIGIYAFFSYDYINQLSILIFNLFDVQLTTSVQVSGTMVMASILVILPPTILMGGTLPILSRCVSQLTADIPRGIAGVYGLNTLGAAFGILAVPFLLLNYLSIDMSIRLIVVINASLAIALFALGRKASPNEVAEERGHPRRTAPGLLSISFFIGFLSICIEVSLFRSFSANHPSSPYNFPLVLFHWLLGLALASILVERFKMLNDKKRIVDYFVAAIIGFIISIGIRYLMPSYQNIDLGERVSFADFILLFPLVGLFPLAIGGVFPILVASGSDKTTLQSNAGNIYLVNSIGSFLGGVLFQFVLVPAWGTPVSLAVVTAIAFGAVSAVLAERRLRAALLMLGAFLAVTPMRDAFFGKFVYGNSIADRVGQEGYTGVVSAEWGAGAVTLYNPLDLLKGAIRVNGNIMGTYPNHPKHMRDVAIIMGTRKFAKALILGLGSGALPRDLIRLNPESHFDIVDWSNELAPVLRSIDDRAQLNGLMDSANMSFFNLDARTYLKFARDGDYDLVFDNLIVSGASGSTQLKSESHLREIARLLKPTGVFYFDTNWSPATKDAIIATTMKYFKYVYSMDCAAVLIASQAPVDLSEVAAGLDSQQEVVLKTTYKYCSDLTNIALLDRNAYAGVDTIKDNVLDMEYTKRIPIDKLASFVRRSFRKPFE